ncbi:hypothetical protein EZS27_010537 [termite gut metagenome]|uniref:Fimbrillin family protein n=1 Tax=termite gut metagenome TaxID=433724 RepID=A0A5J4S6E7_9ZZZZ
MKQILVTLPVIIFSLFSLNACDSDKELNNDNQEGQIIRFQVEASGFEVSTTSSDTRLDVEGCKFEDGDEIGLFAVKRKRSDNATYNDLKSAEEKNFIHNAKLTYDSFRNEWAFDTPVSYPIGADTIVYDFYAYYPYQEDLDPTAMNINGVLDNQEGRSTLGKSDFMTAYERGHTERGGTVKLKFNHHFSLVKFDVLSAGSSSPFANVAFNTSVYSVEKFELILVALGREEGRKELVYTKERKNILIGMHKLDDNKAAYQYQAIVIPQTVTGDAPLFYYSLSGNKGDNGLFSISSKNLITIDDNDGKFEKEKSYKFSYNYKP